MKSLGYLIGLLSITICTAKLRMFEKVEVKSVYGNVFCCLFAAASINVCSRNEPNLSECIISSVKELQPRLASGQIDPNFIVPVSCDDFFCLLNCEKKL